MTLRGKLLAGFLPATVAFTGLLAYLTLRDVEGLAVQEVEALRLAWATEAAANAGEGLSKRREALLLPVLQRLREEGGAAYAAVLDPAGRVLAHTNLVEMGSVRSDPWTRRALAADRPVSLLSREGGEPTLKMAVPILAPETDLLSAGDGPRPRLGTLKLGIPVGAALDMGLRIAQRQAAITACFALALLALNLLFLRGIVRSVRELAEAVARIAAGEFGIRVAVLTRDEVGDLAAGFNAMSEKLRASSVSKDALDAVVESTADGILVVDRGGRITHFNKRFAEMWRIPRSALDAGDAAEAMESVLEQLRDPGGFRTKVSALYANLEAESFDSLEFKDGRVFERFSLPLHIGGRAAGRVWSFRDATGRALAEEGLRRQSAALARSNEDLRQFAHAASHDLKEPLRMVASYTQLLAERYRGRLDADADEFIHYASEGAVRMQELLDDLLDYVGLEAVSRPTQSVDVDKAFDDAVDNLRLRIEESGAQVSRSSLPRLWGDPSQLAELFQNLIDNALKFCGDSPPLVAVDAVRRDGCWEFSVADNGIGIDPKHHQRIFVIFQQLHARGRYRGTGVGLALCKRIVERHGGRLWLESQPGKGSVFRFTIPEGVGAPERTA